MIAIDQGPDTMIKLDTHRKIMNLDRGKIDTIAFRAVRAPVPVRLIPVVPEAVHRPVNRATITLNQTNRSR